MNLRTMNLEQDRPGGANDPNAVPQTIAAGASAPPAQNSGQLDPDTLHDLFAGGEPADGADDEDPLAAMRRDPNYAALLEELKLIAEAARSLFPQAEPSDKVWQRIADDIKDPAVFREGTED